MSSGVEEVGESGGDEYIPVDTVILDGLDPAGSPESTGFKPESSDSPNLTSTAGQDDTDWDQTDNEPVIQETGTRFRQASDLTDDMPDLEPETTFTTDFETEEESMEEIVPLTDDSLFGSHYFQDPNEPIDIANIVITSEEQARDIALYILDELEADVFAYFDGWGEGMPGTEDTQTGMEDEIDRLLKTKVAETDSGISLSSDYSMPLVGEPSTLKLSYEKGDAEPFRVTSIQRIRLEDTKDEACEVNFHRSAKRFGRNTRLFYDDFTQTKELSFVSHFEAEQIYRSLYPLKDDYTPPAVPSRKGSLDLVLDEADNEKADGDRGRIGAKVRWSKKKRLLPPLPENYAKGETFWTGSIFRGKYVNRQLNHGNYNYPLMSSYESEFKEGHAHSKKHLGLVVYPRGDSFEGQWRKGRFMSGNITFGDELKFEPQKWTYCVPPDRRFYIERDVGVKQAGRTLYNDRLPPPRVAPGCYDAGDGIYDPKTGVVTGYNGQKLRDASVQECQWILANCRKSKTVPERYSPSFHEARLPCSYVDKYVKQ